ncbi:MAG: 16S rRNA (guanine(527)-N(7))-methyltransferase RsmG [Phycisphaeraceae bacterium]
MLKAPQSFLDDCKTVGLSLNDETIQMLGRYLHLLLETNKKFNLTAIKEPEQAWRRHILESLALLPFLEGATTVIDVGSGGGLPGLPLAIASPERRFTLLDATGKKARFLETAVAELGLTNVTVLNDRAETAGQSPQHRQRYDVAVSRAVGPMNVLLELTLPLVQVDGRFIALKGAKAEAELRDAGDALVVLGGGEVEAYEALPNLEDEAVVVVVYKLATTPPEYPRRPGQPKQEPL